MSRPRLLRRLAAAYAVLFAAGCAALSPREASLYGYLVRLKAYHLKLIDDYTVSSPSDPFQFDAGKIQEQYSHGELLVREALEYVKGLPRAKRGRTDAFETLAKAYRKDGSQLLVRALQGKNHFVKAVAAEVRRQREAAYDAALRGRWAEVTSP